LGWTYALVTSLLQHASLSTTVFNLAVIALSFAGMSGVLLAFGVSGAKFDWNDPRQMTRGSAGCVGVLVSLFYIAISGGLFYVPPLAAGLLKLSDAIGQGAGLALGGVFGLVCAYIPLQMVYKRVERLGES
jgi:hypothetical protein